MFPQSIGSLLRALSPYHSSVRTDTPAMRLPCARPHARTHSNARRRNLADQPEPQPFPTQIYIYIYTFYALHVSPLIFFYIFLGGSFPSERSNGQITSIARYFWITDTFFFCNLLPAGVGVSSGANNRLIHHHHHRHYSRLHVKGPPYIVLH